MRVCIQRVSRANVRVDNEIVGEIGAGLVVLLGVEHADTQSDADYLARKVVELRIFEDDEGKMNRSLPDVGGQMLVISQFTLLGDCRKGRRPSFVAAADPKTGNALYERFVQSVRDLDVETATGVFGAHMKIELINDGPVTMLLDSKKLF